MPPKCLYVKTRGARCGALALTGKPYCFWHEKLNRHHAESDGILVKPKFYNQLNDLKYREENPLYDQYFANTRVNGPISKELPPLEDAESVQLALSLVVASIADGRIDLKRASMLLYGLQIASQNVRRVHPAEEDAVTETSIDNFGTELAGPAPEPESLPIDAALIDSTTAVDAAPTDSVTTEETTPTDSAPEEEAPLPLAPAA